VSGLQVGWGWGWVVEGGPLGDVFELEGLELNLGSAATTKHSL